MNPLLGIAAAVVASAMLVIIGQYTIEAVGNAGSISTSTGLLGLVNTLLPVLPVVGIVIGMVVGFGMLKGR